MKEDHHDSAHHLPQAGRESIGDSPTRQRIRGPSHLVTLAHNSHLREHQVAYNRQYQRYQPNNCLQLCAGRGGSLPRSTRDMTDYATFTDGNVSGSEAGTMARYVIIGYVALPNLWMLA